MEDRYLDRFDQLILQHSRAAFRDDGTNIGSSNNPRITSHDWFQWFTSAFGLIRVVFGEDSPHFKNLELVFDRSRSTSKDNFDTALGVFEAAKSDYEGGYYVMLTRTVAGEVFADFVELAKEALAEGNKDVAAVLACAALEDALKRYATLNDLDVHDQSMQTVVAALKSKGLVQGGEKKILEAMPSIRNDAMHANWDNITSTNIGSVIGFVENFLLTRFS